MKRSTTLGLILLLLLPPSLAAAGAPTDRIRETVEQVLAILKDPGWKKESKTNERRAKLKDIIARRFDFTEMAKRSLGSEWRRRTPQEQKEFVQLLTDLLERAYLDKIDSASGEKVQYGRERVDGDHAEVNTKIIDSKGREFSVDYRLHLVNGDWKVYDVIIDDISLVNNYRAQFNRVLANSSYEKLVERLKEKNFSAPPTKG
jgi:phospholipid transport system substrate-binding protein